MKKLIRVYFWIGVNVIGIPELFVHNFDKREITNKSRFFGDKRTSVYLFNQTLELL